MKKLKADLLDMGASIVGFGKVQDYYKKIKVSDSLQNELKRDYTNLSQYDYGISIAIKIPKEIIKGISEYPTIDYYHTYYKLNEKLDELAVYCEEYLIHKGYRAYAQTVDRTKEYRVLTTIMPHKTVAVCAGIGWIGKSALLVTTKFGSAIRLTSVLTNAPLSVAKTVLESLCKNCSKCRDVCPADAITGNTWDKEYERDYIFDAGKCRTMARKIAKQVMNKEITLCGKCIEVCPFTQRYLKSDD